MAQLSRPYQIVLAAVALLGLVWVVALHGHGSGQHESTGTAPAPAPSARTEAKAAAKATPIYHGAAPGVEGLTRAIAKAHGAVATSQRNAAELAQRSREASREGAAGSASVSHTSSTQHNAARGEASVHGKATSTHRGAPQHGAHARHITDHRPALQVAVEHEVRQSKTVLLLFWDSKSSVDREVRSETQAMVASSKGRLALHAVAPNQVGEFGSVTEVVHVYQTPTILIVNRRGVVSTLTGLTDTFALRQLVREAQRAH